MMEVAKHEMKEDLMSGMKKGMKDQKTRGTRDRACCSLLLGNERTCSSPDAAQAGESVFPRVFQRQDGLRGVLWLKW